MQNVFSEAPREVAVLHLQGADAERFAHAQFASDVRALPLQRWQWSAWLDVQGRVRALLQLARIADTRFLALLRGGDAHTLAAALGRFLLRDKLQLTAQKMRLLPGAALAMNQVQLQVHAIVLGMDTHSWMLSDAQTDSAPPSNIIEDASRANVWLHELRAGWPWLPDAALDALLPPALGLEHLGAVRFDKGCYPGQEIAARLHFRGGNKRELVRLRGPAHAIEELSRSTPEALQVLLMHRDRADDSIEMLGILNTSSTAASAYTALIVARYTA
jgi:folate-binding protein YgfZ